MYIKFKKVRYKNLLSTGDSWIEVNLNKYKNVLFNGVSGSGKSQLNDSLCYVLFNKPFRNINKPQLKNSINKKNTLVEVEFSSGNDEFLIRRGMAPNVFEIIKNGKLIDQTDARDYQKILETNYLRMNYKTFKQIVILGTASFKPFMQLNPAERREVIEDLLDIQIFSKMNILLKDKVDQNKIDLSNVDRKLEVVQEKIKLHDEHLHLISTDINSRKKELKEKIDRIKSDQLIEATIVKEKTNQINELSKKIVTIETVKANKNKIQNIITQLLDKIKKLEKEIIFYKQHENCPVCAQVIDSDFRSEMISDKEKVIEETNFGLSKANTQFEKLKKTLSSMEMIKSDIDDINLDVKIKKNKIKTLDDNIKDLTIQIEKLDYKITVDIDDNEKTKELEKEKDDISLEKRKLIELRDIYKASSIILKDNGIKSQIIKQYIPIINKLVNKYLSEMNLFIQFELDENFNETIKSRYRDDFSYFSFSEGQKSRIDLALLFTWRTIAKMRNSASSNLLILDEVTSSSLDGESIDALMRILLSLENTNIIMMSHNPDIKDKDIFDQVYKFELKQNFTEMTEA